MEETRRTAASHVEMAKCRRTWIRELSSGNTLWCADSVREWNQVQSGLMNSAEQGGVFMFMAAKSNNGHKLATGKSNKNLHSNNLQDHSHNHDARRNPEQGGNYFRGRLECVVVDQLRTNKPFRLLFAM